jgi:hypothetical protein
MKTIEKKTDKLAEIKNALTAGCLEFVRAGELIVEALEEGGLSLAGISDAIDIPIDVLSQLEKIGRHQLSPQLLLAEYPAARKLERLPMSEQERVMIEPIEVLVLRDGQTDTLLVNVQHMTPAQTRQVFAANHIRGLSEQRQWLESQVKTGDTVKIETPYVLTRKSTVIFHQGCEMTAKELLRIAAQLQD